MGFRNGRYVFDFEPLKRFFGGLSKPRPAQPAKPKPMNSYQKAGQAIKTHNQEIRDLTEGKY